ncbi:MAG: phosphate acyltransferase PlsX [Clostridia bacterium]|nr:phosphate acyltransferase PlsX [Clostridia bacterium]MBQ8371718.1 phosphate acyltransferase PlsX [Clostridia bacterium]
MSKILIDPFGCDHPDEMILGVAKAINSIDGVELAVVGDREYIERRLESVSFDRSRLEIINASEVITCEDSPVRSIRQKKDSSLVVAYDSMREREDLPILITAGNSGAVIAGAMLVLGRDHRDDIPTLVSMLPTDKGGVACLADCGANVDCRPENIVKYAKYASDYMHRVYGIESPRVALLSVGTEDTKGNTQTKETFALLKETELNFVGNMEARTALTGDVDVIVTDGFAGNVLLKTIEGTAKSVGRLMVGSLKRNLPEGTDPSFINKVLADLNSTLDFNTMGGGIILGVKKPIIKAHGAANIDTVVNTVKQAIRIITSGRGLG